MRGRFMAGLLLATAGLPGCGDLGGQSMQYRIQVRCVMSDGKPVQGVRLGGAGAGAMQVESDAEGNVALHVEGREGQEVGFEVLGVPPSLVLADGNTKRAVILKHYGARDARRASELSHEIRLRARKEPYVVLVSAAQAPGVEIAASNAAEPVARLNSRSAAAFLTEGKPGDELKVTLLASRVSRQKAGDPTQTFILKEGENILAFQSDLYIKPVVAAAPKKVTRTARPPTIIRSWAGGK